MDLVILFFGLMSHVRGDGDRAAVLINAPGHTAEMRIAQGDVRTPIPSQLQPSAVGDYYHIPLNGFRVTTNVGFGSPRLDASILASVPGLATVSNCRDLREQVVQRAADEEITAYFIYRGGTLTVAEYQQLQGKFEVWPEERCMPQSLEYRIADARNVELIFTSLVDNATWTFGIQDGTHLTISNRSGEAGHFHHQYKIFKDCTGPSPTVGGSCTRAGLANRQIAKIEAHEYDIECSPSQTP